MSAPHFFGRAIVGDGARNVGVDIGPVKVLLTPATKDDEAEAMRMACDLMGVETLLAALRNEVSALQAEKAGLAERVRMQNNALALAKTVNDAAIAGRRRFFSAVTMKPAEPGNWAGAVWLLDPVKLERGHGLRFSSVAEVRELHPELWVVAVNADGSVTLDAWGKS